MVFAPQSWIRRYEAEFANSRRLHQQAKELFPNGVTHDLRHLEPFPVYIHLAEGSHKWDVDGHELIDYWSGHGALLLGHGHPAVVEAVQRQAARGTHPGACHELEIEWGQWVRKLIPSAEKLRFVSSGTEATLMALRLARIFTGKPKVLKFAGHFHGWHDFLIPGADLPSDGKPVPGIPGETAANTVIIPPNDSEKVERTLAGDPEIGSVILEPTGGHFGAVPIRGDFLKALRDITTRLGRLLIFDEVITGFRVHPGGAQGYYGVTPDLTTLAKILAGGLPGGCLVGRADILASLEFRPGKPKMKHPGTFNANPLSASAGITTLKIISTGQPPHRSPSPSGGEGGVRGPCQIANERARSLRRKLNELFAKRNANWIAYGEFSGFKLLSDYDGPGPTTEDFVPYNGDVNRLGGSKTPGFVHAFRCAMLLNGVDLPGLGGMTMAAHSEADVDRTVAAVAATLDLL
jgi:glutamate-1-semialdehyde 2,1-aminomutase